MGRLVLVPCLLVGVPCTCSSVGSMAQLVLLVGMPCRCRCRCCEHERTRGLKDSFYLLVLRVTDRQDTKRKKDAQYPRVIMKLTSDAVALLLDDKQRSQPAVSVGLRTVRTFTF